MKKKIWIVCWWDEVFDKDVVIASTSDLSLLEEDEMAAVTGVANESIVIKAEYFADGAAGRSGAPILS